MPPSFPIHPTTKDNNPRIALIPYFTAELGWTELCAAHSQSTYGLRLCGEAVDFAVFIEVILVF